MEAEAGQGLFQAPWKWRSQVFKGGLCLLGLMVGRGCLGLGLLCRGRNVARLGMQTPDQCCATEHSAKIEKWCHMWLLNIWNMISRTEQQDFEFYLIWINFKWSHVASSDSWLTYPWNILNFVHIPPPNLSGGWWCAPRYTGLFCHLVTVSVAPAASIPFALFSVCAAWPFLWLSMSPSAPQASCKSPSLHCLWHHCHLQPLSALQVPLSSFESCWSSHSHNPLPFPTSFILQCSCKLAIF